MEKNNETNTYLGSSFIGGVVGAEIVSKYMLNSKPVSINGERIHHWEVGIGLCVVGLIAMKSEDKKIRTLGLCLTGLGIGIFLHDVNDFLS
jgi:hypothetical protein